MYRKEEMKRFIQVANTKQLPYKEKSFGLVMSIIPIRNRSRRKGRQALREIRRMSRMHAYVSADIWFKVKECESTLKSNPTGLTP